MHFKPHSDGLQYSYFPGLVLSWKLLEQFIFQITGWRTTYTSAMMQWESVGTYLSNNKAQKLILPQWASGAHAKAMSSRFTQPAVPNFIHTLVNSGLHPETALSEARENIGPGTDTTSATLAHILFALAYNPEYQQTLREDLADLDFPTQMTRLESIPKLTACIKEGIRWAGAASAMLPRVVPPEGTTLEGYFLPGGVRSLSYVPSRLLSLIDCRLLLDHHLFGAHLVLARCHRIPGTTLLRSVSMVDSQRRLP